MRKTSRGIEFGAAVSFICIVVSMLILIVCAFIGNANLVVALAIILSVISSIGIICTMAKYFAIWKKLVFFLFAEAIQIVPYLIIIGIKWLFF